MELVAHPPDLGFHPLAPAFVWDRAEHATIHQPGYVSRLHALVEILDPRIARLRVKDPASCLGADFVAPLDQIYEKTQSNIEEVKARRGPIIAITTESNTELGAKVDDVIYVPRTLDCLTPLLTVVPLQLLAYHIAVARDCDVDKPRNLAKSVTVE